MSDFHVLDQAEDQKTVNVVFHFAVPATKNAANVFYRTALVGYLGGAENITSQVADATELTAMKAGEVLERTQSVRWSRLGLFPSQKLAEIEAAYAAARIKIAAYFSTVLEFYGYEGDVA